MTGTINERTRKVKSILVTQEAPSDAASPYFKLAEKYGLKVDFRPFIQVEGISAKDFRRQKVEILRHTAVIFTSRNAVDHFFTLARELKIDIPQGMKYFCISDQTQNFYRLKINRRVVGYHQKTQKRKIPFPMLRHSQKRYSRLFEIPQLPIP